MTKKERIFEADVHDFIRKKRDLDISLASFKYWNDYKIGGFYSPEYSCELVLIVQRYIEQYNFICDTFIMEIENSPFITVGDVITAQPFIEKIKSCKIYTFNNPQQRYIFPRYYDFHGKIPARLMDELRRITNEFQNEIDKAKKDVLKSLWMHVLIDMNNLNNIMTLSDFLETT